MLINYVGAFRLPNLDAAAPRVINNAKALRKAGCEVIFISWGGTYRKEDLCMDGKYRVCGFEYVISGDLPIGGSIWDRFSTRLHRGRRSINLMKSLPRPDLIITYNASNAFTKIMIRYCKAKDIKLANDVSEWYSNNELHFIDVLSNYINMVYTQQLVKNKIVISSFLDSYYSDSNNVLVPPLCDQDEPKWTTFVDDERIKPFKGVTLIYAGNPAKKDCIHSVIRAVNTLANEGKLIRFLILGISREDYMRRHNSSLIGGTSIHDNVLFLGRVSQDLIPAYYRKADFMVLLREPNRKSMAGFPTKFAESMTAGIPVITNATSDLPKYVINGKTGFLSIGFDYDSVLYTLRKSVLPLSSNEICEMKENVKMSRSAFDWNSHVNDFKVFIKSLRPL